MGRSQVKYRTTHGRGRGRRRDDGAGRAESFERGQASHLRNLGSNAHRFEKHEEQDDGQVVDHQTQGGRTQFFASEQRYREKTVSASGEYFQSRVMKQWEERDTTADDCGAIGKLDLDWIASQLKLLSPDIRYRMDPKYCTDLPFKPQEKESCPHVATEGMSATTLPTPAQRDEKLDFLLNLSASTSSESKSSSTPAVALPAQPAAIMAATETEQLEEWLDNVLDI